MSEPPSVRVCVGSGDLAAQHVKSLRGNGNCGNAGEKYKNPPSFVKKKTRLLLSLLHCGLFSYSFWYFPLDGDGSDNVTGLLIIVRVLLLLLDIVVVAAAAVVVVVLRCQTPEDGTKHTQSRTRALEVDFRHPGVSTWCFLAFQSNVASIANA